VIVSNTLTVKEIWKIYLLEQKLLIINILEKNTNWFDPVKCTHMGTYLLDQYPVINVILKMKSGKNGVKCKILVIWI
jgi:hypothetical protein